MMNIIRSKSPADLWPWDIPWPVLPRSVHNFPVKNNHSLLGRDMVGNSVKKFTESYASWKVHPIHRIRAMVLTDWTSIVDKTPQALRSGASQALQSIVKKPPQRGSTCSGSGLPLAGKLSAAQDATLSSGCPQDSGLAGPSLMCPLGLY
jgi:hypothetical protein